MYQVQHLRPKLASRKEPMLHDSNILTLRGVTRS